VPLTPPPSRDPGPAGRALAALALALAAAALPAAAAAGSFTANPIRLTLAPNASTTSLTLENTGEEPVTVQASLMSWSQEGGRDQLTASTDLIVSPPIFKLAPRARQTIRVGVLRPADPKVERAYRLYLTEVPPPRTPDQVGVTVALQLGIPLFVQPAAPVARKLDWRARPLDGGQIELSVTNAGNTHVQVVSATLAGDGDAPLVEHAARSYVLPGTSSTWRLEPARPWRGEPLRITTQTPDGNLSGPVAVP
jgi:fimbrial chaperone protein